MARWPVKCAVDSAKALIPFQAPLRRIKDRAIGYRREPKKDAATIRDGLDLLKWLGDVRGLSILEVGTGWQPMIPVLFSLAGAKVFMTDLNALLRKDTFNAALESVRELKVEIAQSLGIKPEAVAHAARACDNISARMQELGLTYMAPCDCANVQRESQSLDVVMSRAVLEHISPNVITAIFAEAHRLLRPGGRMLHLVDHSDHWSHRDKSISAVNFLWQPEWLFRLTCINPLNYQNRLRHSDYCSILEKTGFTVQREQKEIDRSCMELLKDKPVPEPFRRFSVEELATTSSILLAESYITPSQAH